ncbi:hypothetical protein D7X88_07670 [bacterium C-53]|nr:hypothetical protein [Lachnospiraceae bacterium]NBI03094.1 hypothetical protein [Lachnospiraceae bacterium]RKJ10702.1 hypothetical protein D7X88_07670 [bacterium C-53]
MDICYIFHKNDKYTNTELYSINNVINCPIIMSQEAVCIMMNSYDQKEVMSSYVRSKEHDTKIETAKRYLAMGKLSFEEIAIDF